MVDLKDLLTPERVVVDLKANSKRQALRALAGRAAETVGLSPEDLLDRLLEREKLGTTGIGEGMAIPHAKIEGIEKLTGVFARLARPVDFDSLDDQPVDLVFLLLAPADAGAEHLKALARIARLFRDANVCGALRTETDPARIYAYLTGTGRPAAGGSGA